MSREQRTTAVIGVAVFLAGAALLGLEIAASRVLAPYFGNSLYVWGALIGIVLAGLSTGYWVGGVVADRYPTSRLIVAMLASSSLLVLAIPFVDGWVLDRLVDWDPGPRLNPLLATIFLFGTQSVVLGTVATLHRTQIGQAKGHVLFKDIEVVVALAMRQPGVDLARLGIHEEGLDPVAVAAEQGVGQRAVAPEHARSMEVHEQPRHGIQQPVTIRSGTERETHQ